MIYIQCYRSLSHVYFRPATANYCNTAYDAHYDVYASRLHPHADEVHEYICLGPISFAYLEQTGNFVNIIIR